MKSTVASAMPGEAKTGYQVVMHLAKNLYGKGHMVFMDNFFTSVKLLMDLAAQRTFATGTVRSDRIGLPKVLSDKQAWSKKPQGSIGWRMHVNGKISCVTWVDRKPVLLLSTHASPISIDPSNQDRVPRRNQRGQKIDVPTSPVHLAYTKWMRGVDVSDQLRG